MHPFRYRPCLIIGPIFAHAPLATTIMILLSILAQIALVVGIIPEFSAWPCSEDLQATYEAAYAKELANWLGNTTTDPFYQSLTNVSAYSPGQTIRIEKINRTRLEQYAIPPGLSLYRMLYQSIDIDDVPVPASAFILLPYTRSLPNVASPFKLIVWAHGTSGIERQCAPSNQRGLYYNYEGPFSMALRGYAVIAPDYAGQGTDTPFNYLAAPSHAADVAYSVVAARETLLRGLITHHWVVVGHSEGGLTAWATNEREVTNPIGGFLGAVSIAPALQNLHIIRHGLANGSLSGSLFYSAYTLSTIARLDKSVDITQYFSDVGLELSRLAATACFNTAAAVFANLTFADIFKDQTWINSRWAVSWENRTAVRGDKLLAKPLLVIEGLGDLQVYPAIPDAVFAKHCQNHPDTQAHLSRYPEMGHDAVAFASQVEYFNWIDDRFNAVQVSEGCTTATVNSVFTEPDPLHALVVQA